MTKKGEKIMKRMILLILGIACVTVVLSVRQPVRAACGVGPHVDNDTCNQMDGCYCDIYPCGEGICEECYQFEFGGGSLCTCGTGEYDCCGENTWPGSTCYEEWACGEDCYGCVPVGIEPNTYCASANEPYCP